MKIYYGNGAMYAKVEDGDEIEKVPVELGDRKLYPGQYINRLGHGKRSFEMQDGWFLRYEGRVGEILLFYVNAEKTVDFYYAFIYVTPKELLVQRAQNSFYDIRVEHLEVYDEVPQKDVSYQLAIF